jgi:hypothetical protein
MSVKAEVCPLQETASLAGQRLAGGERSNSLEVSSDVSSSLPLVVEDEAEGVRVTPSWKVLSRPRNLLGV